MPDILLQLVAIAGGFWLLTVIFPRFLGIVLGTLAAGTIVLHIISAIVFPLGILMLLARMLGW